MLQKRGKNALRNATIIHQDFKLYKITFVFQQQTIAVRTASLLDYSGRKHVLAIGTQKDNLLPFLLLLFSNILKRL